MRKGDRLLMKTKIAAKIPMLLAAERSRSLGGNRGDRLFGNKILSTTRSGAGLAYWKIN